MVKNLLEQNECLILNIMEIKQESSNRINELRRNLENTAARTEEVMLSLQSHELCLKDFVQKHCCQCCSCDMRLMEFKLCHGLHCDQYNNHQLNEINKCSIALQSQCWSLGHFLNPNAHQSSHWFANYDLLPSALQTCPHNLSSEIRYLNLVELMEKKFNQFEMENEHLRKENQMIRELNSLINCQLEKQTRTENCKHLLAKVPIYNNHHSADSSISLSPVYGFKNDLDNELMPDHLQCFNIFDNSDETNEIMNKFFSINSENYDGEECRQDNDSGCSTDLIPSQTDMQSLLALSDLDEDPTTGTTAIVSEDQIIKNIIRTMNSTVTVTDDHQPTPAIPSTTKDNDILLNSSKSLNHSNESNLDNNSSHNSPLKPPPPAPTVTTDLNEIDNLKNRVNLAEQLIPKLYNKLLYYMNQRNLLLSQFRQENRAREKCKQELSLLTECLLDNLKCLDTKSNIKNMNPSKNTNDNSQTQQPSTSSTTNHQLLMIK